MAHDIDVKFYPGWTRKAITFSIDDGILDSFDIVSIVAELCEEYDVTITVDMLEPENFNSASAMLALVEQLLDEQ